MSLQLKESLVVKLSNLRQGVEEKFPANGTVTIGNQTVDKAGFLALIDAKLAPFLAAEEAEKTHRQKIVERDAAEPDSLAFYNQSSQVMRGWCGNDGQTLSAYGIKPRKARRQMTGAERLAMKTKAAKTRELRHTMSDKDKAKLKATGDVEVSATLGANPAPGSGESGSASGSVNGAANSIGGNGSTAP